MNRPIYCYCRIEGTAPLLDAYAPKDRAAVEKRAERGQRVFGRPMIPWESFDSLEIVPR